MFDWTRFPFVAVKSHNFKVADPLGNLFQRALSVAQSRFGGQETMKEVEWGSKGQAAEKDAEAILAILAIDTFHHVMDKSWVYSEMQEAEGSEMPIVYPQSVLEAVRGLYDLSSALRSAQGSMEGLRKELATNSCAGAKEVGGLNASADAVVQAAVLTGKHGSNVLLNFLCAAWAVNRFLRGEITAPVKKNQDLSSLGDFGQDEKVNPIRRMRIHDLAKNWKNLCVPFHLALTISPMVLLSKRMLCSRSSARAPLVQAWMVLTGRKPAYLRLLEYSIWECVLELAREDIDMVSRVEACLVRLENGAGILQLNGGDRSVRFFSTCFSGDSAYLELGDGDSPEEEDAAEATKAFEGLDLGDVGKQATEEAVCLRKTVSEPDLPLGEAPSAKATQERVEAVPEPLFLAESSAEPTDDDVQMAEEAYSPSDPVGIHRDEAVATVAGDVDMEGEPSVSTSGVQATDGSPKGHTAPQAGEPGRDARLIVGPGRVEASKAEEGGSAKGEAKGVSRDRSSSTEGVPEALLGTPSSAGFPELPYEPRQQKARPPVTPPAASTPIGRTGPSVDPDRTLVDTARVKKRRLSALSEKTLASPTMEKKPRRASPKGSPVKTMIWKPMSLGSKDEEAHKGGERTVAGMAAAEEMGAGPSVNIDRAVEGEDGNSEDVEESGEEESDEEAAGDVIMETGPTVDGGNEDEGESGEEESEEEAAGDVVMETGPTVDGGNEDEGESDEEQSEEEAAGDAVMETGPTVDGGNEDEGESDEEQSEEEAVMDGPAKVAPQAKSQGGRVRKASKPQKGKAKAIQKVAKQAQRKEGRGEDVEASSVRSSSIAPDQDVPFEASYDRLLSPISLKREVVKCADFPSRIFTESGTPWTVDVGFEKASNGAAAFRRALSLCIQNDDAKQQRPFFHRIDHDEYAAAKSRGAWSGVLGKCRSLDKNIIVTNVPDANMDFHQALASLGRPLDREFLFNDFGSPGSEGKASSTMATLRQVEAASGGAKGRSLSCRDFVISRWRSEPLFDHHDLLSKLWDATEDVFVEARACPAFLRQRATISTTGAHVRPQVNSMGFATLIRPLHGAELWIVACQDEEARSSPRVYTDRYDGEKQGSWRAVILRPTEAMILAPGVAHASFTLQPTVGLEMQIYEERWLHRTFISAFLGLLSPDSVFEHHPVRTVRVMMRFLKLFQWVYSERELDDEYWGDDVPTLGSWECMRATVVLSAICRVLPNIVGLKDEEGTLCASMALTLIKTADSVLLVTQLTKRTRATGLFHDVYVPYLRQVLQTAAQSSKDPVEKLRSLGRAVKEAEQGRIGKLPEGLHFRFTKEDLKVELKKDRRPSHLHPWE